MHYKEIHSLVMTEHKKILRITFVDGTRKCSGAPEHMSGSPFCSALCITLYKGSACACRPYIRRRAPRVLCSSFCLISARYRSFTSCLLSRPPLLLSRPPRLASRPPHLVSLLPLVHSSPQPPLAPSASASPGVTLPTFHIRTQKVE